MHGPVNSALAVAVSPLLVTSSTLAPVPLFYLRTRMLSTLPLLLALANAPIAAAPAQDPAQQVARRAVQQGRYVPLESVVRDALKRYPGQLLEVELDDGVYEVGILRGDGVVVELDYDARSGKLLKTELDD